MNTLYLNGVLAFALAVPPIFAQSGSEMQTPPAPATPAQIVADQVARLTALLDLTTAQQTTANSIFTAEQTTASGLDSSFQSAQTALTAAIQKNDKAGIASAAGQIGTLTTQRVTAEATAAAAFYLILTKISKPS